MPFVFIGEIHVCYVYVWSEQYRLVLRVWAAGFRDLGSRV